MISSENHIKPSKTKEMDIREKDEDLDKEFGDMLNQLDSTNNQDIYSFLLQRRCFDLPDLNDYINKFSDKYAKDVKEYNFRVKDKVKLLNKVKPWLDAHEKLTK